MSVGTTVRMYLIGKTPEEAIKNNDPYLWEREAHEDALEEENVYEIAVTLFASRLKQIEKLT